MIIYANSRKSGKTIKAIKLAASTHSLLIVADRDMARFAEREALELGYPIKAMGARDFFDPRNINGREAVSVVIDELDSVLSSIFRCNVIMATTTGCIENAENKEDKSC